MFEGKSLLITGGTGSFGKAFVRKLLKSYPDIRRVIIYSRDELKQFEMSQEDGLKTDPRLRFFIGDVRDKSRLTTALEDVQFVVHAAAMKQVPASEYNPFECIKTNIFGAQNVIEASIEQRVQSVLALSTDKAAAPVNLYGATKLASDKLFVSANNITGKKDIKFCVLRYGNVMGSRGSVVPFFRRLASSGKLPITDNQMTRFTISLEQGVEFALMVLKYGLGGEIFVPKLPSYRLVDLAKSIAPDCELKHVRRRPGEKFHEGMITSTDSENTYESDSFFIIFPDNTRGLLDHHMSKFNLTSVVPGFSYNSRDNHHFLSVEELKDVLKNVR